MVSERIILLMLENEIISSEDKEVYLYGLHQGLIILGNLLTIFLIGYYFDSLLESILFLMAYIPLRSYAGGYHTRSALTCYFFSIVMIFVFIFLTKFFFWNGISLAGITLISALIITLLAPVEDLNKQLDKYEKQIYRIITYVILWFLMAMDLFFWTINYSQISVIITITIAVIALMLLLGKLNNRYLLKNKSGLGEININE